MTTKGNYGLIVLLMSIALCINWQNELNRITDNGGSCASNFQDNPATSEDYLFLDGGTAQGFLFRTGYSFVPPIQLSPQLGGDFYSKWSTTSFDSQPNEIMSDWVGLFNGPEQLQNALENLSRFRSDQTLLIVGGKELTERHLPEIASVAKLRLLIVDSSTLSDHVLEKHLGSRKDLRVVRSQRLWIEQLREFATQGGTVVAKKNQCVDLPALVDDLHRLQIVEISRQGTHYFVKGGPVPSDKLDIMHRISTVQYLDLSESDISDEQLSRLSELSDLRFLNLSATQLTGTTLEDLNRDSILRLDVSQTQLATSLPELPNLELLIAREVIAASLFGSSGMPKLKALDVGGTILTESDLEALVTFGALQHVVVDERYREHPAINQLVARKVSVEFVGRKVDNSR